MASPTPAWKNGSFDVQLFPKWKSQRHLFGAGGYAIFKTSKQKDLAWEVIKLLVKPETFDIVFPGNVTTPARKSLMTAERLRHDRPEELVGVLRHADRPPRHDANPCPAVLQRSGHRPQPAHHRGDVLR